MLQSGRNLCARQGCSCPRFGSFAGDNYWCDSLFSAGYSFGEAQDVRQMSEPKGCVGASMARQLDLVGAPPPKLKLVETDSSST